MSIFICFSLICTKIFQNHRYGVDGIGWVVLILLLTFLALKYASPSLPGENQEDHWASKWFGEIFCVIFLCFVSFSRHFFDPHKVFIPFLFDFILRVGFPAFYIYNFPSLSLSNFVSTIFEKNVFAPIRELKEIVVDQAWNCVSSRGSPQIDVNV